jgi:hypothetical protein
MKPIIVESYMLPTDRELKRVRRQLGKLVGAGLRGRIVWVAP